MNVPHELKLKLAIQAESDTPGFWLQHHRDAAAHLGIVTRRAGRGTPILQTYYVDYMPQQMFDSLDELRNAAKAVTEAQAAATLANWPRVTATEELVARAHMPCCSVYGEPAVAMLTLVLSWHELCNPLVYLCARALRNMQKDPRPAVWLDTMLAERKGEPT